MKHIAVAIAGETPGVTEAVSELLEAARTVARELQKGMQPDDFREAIVEKYPGLGLALVGLAMASNKMDDIASRTPGVEDGIGCGDPTCQNCGGDGSKLPANDIDAPTARSTSPEVDAIIEQAKANARAARAAGEKKPSDEIPKPTWGHGTHKRPEHVS